MHILFLTHYFPPEGNAPATRVFEMTRRWVKAGHQVTVITGVPNVPNGVIYEGYRNRLKQEEEIEGIRVIRVWTFVAANKGTIKRIMNYASYMVSAFLASLRVKKVDVVMATSPQFFCGYAGVWVSCWKKKLFILEIRDIWPESIVAVGAITEPRIIRFLERLERRLYRAANLVVTVGHGYRSELISRGVPADEIQVVSNGVDLERFSERTPDAELLTKYSLVGAFVVAYVGTVGMACGLDVVLRAARLLKEKHRMDIRFLIVGDGSVRTKLEQAARAEMLDSIVFTGRLEKEEIPRALSAADVCLVHLRRESLFRSVLPSKIFEAAAMARPIILGVEGEAARLVETTECGVCIEPEDEEQLVMAIERLAGNPQWRKRLGAAGRENLAASFDFDRLSDDYIQHVDHLVNGTP